MLGAWRSCKRCGLSKTRRHVVIGSGDVPAQIMVVEDPPGKSEDLMGRPLAGPGGLVFREALKEAQFTVGIVPTIFSTTATGCATNADDPKLREHAACCWRRLERLRAAVAPKRIVLLGDTAKMLCGKAWPEATKLMHPSAIARQGGTSSTLFRTFVRHWEEIIHDVCSE